jgi:hypothetical protein
LAKLRPLRMCLQAKAFEASSDTHHRLSKQAASQH